MAEGLEALPNIGEVLAGELAAIGVTSREDLAALGSVAAARKLAARGRVECYSMLMALEGALRGVRWHAIPLAEREELKRRFDRETDQTGGR